MSDSNFTYELTGLDEMLAQLDDLIPTQEQKIGAVSKAADIYIDHMIPMIPQDEAKKKGKHLRSMVTYKPGQYADGSTDVGFSKQGYYYRFLNDGTKNMKKYPGGLHFMEHAEDEAKEAMQQAMRDSILKGDEQ